MRTLRSISDVGFTLIELLAVLTVIALLFTLTAPRFGVGAARIPERREVAKLRKMLTDARLTALREGRPVAVHLTALDGRAAMQEGSDSATFFADGSSSGGIVTFAGKPVLVIAWLTGDVRDAQ